MWRLARTFLDLNDLFDERPRGGLALPPLTSPELRVRYVL
jgi:hypothetical protein